MDDFYCLKDRFAGCLLGAAIGDALGNPVEGYSHATIQNKYGELKDYQANWDEPGTGTDDTEQTILIAKSITDTGGFSIEDIARRYKEWLPTAESFGTACQTAAVNLQEGKKPHESGINSAGNGAAMRVSPIGLAYSHPEDLELMKRTVEKATTLTHTDKRALAGALAVAYGTSYLINRRKEFKPSAFLDAVVKTAETASQEFAESLDRIKDLLKKAPVSAAEIIGTGGYVAESVPFAFYSFLRSPDDFEDTLITAVNAGGDTDTNASIAGTLSGALNGTQAIPERWISGLKAKEEIIKLSEELFEFYCSNLPEKDIRRFKKQALDKKENSAIARHLGNIGAIQVLRGDYEKGAETFKQALAHPLSEEDSTCLHLLLAKAYEKSGRKKDALKLLEQCKTSNPLGTIAIKLMQEKGSLKDLRI